MVVVVDSLKDCTVVVVVVVIVGDVVTVVDWTVVVRVTDTVVGVRETLHESKSARLNGQNKGSFDSRWASDGGS